MREFNTLKLFLLNMFRIVTTPKGVTIGKFLTRSHFPLLNYCCKWDEGDGFLSGVYKMEKVTHPSFQFATLYLNEVTVIL